MIQIIRPTRLNDFDFRSPLPFSEFKVSSSKIEVQIAYQTLGEQCDRRSSGVCSASSRDLKWFAGEICDFSKHKAALQELKIRHSWMAERTPFKEASELPENSNGNQIVFKIADYEDSLNGRAPDKFRFVRLLFDGLPIPQCGISHLKSQSLNRPPFCGLSISDRLHWADSIWFKLIQLISGFTLTFPIVLPVTRLLGLITYTHNV